MNEFSIKLLKANVNTEEHHISLAKQIDDEDLDCSQDSEVRRIRELIKETGREMHKLKGFVRFNHLGDKVKFGYMKPEHDIGEIVAEWFAKRFPGKIIVLGNNRMCWVSIHTDKELESTTKKESMKKVIEKFKEKFDIDSEVNFDEIWETYYRSQYSKQRKNVELFKNKMPEKFRKRAKNNVENRYNCETLDKFE